MKKLLSIITVLAGLALIAMEFFYESHLLLTIVGILIGAWMVMEGVLEIMQVTHGYILRWKML